MLPTSLNLDHQSPQFSTADSYIICYSVINNLCGWIYAAAFIGGYFFISLEIYQKKTSAGLSWNYFVLSLLGYLYYLFYFFWGMESRSSDIASSIHFQDFLFIICSVLWHPIVFFQMRIYPGCPENKVSWVYAGLCALSFGSIFVVYAITGDAVETMTFMGTLKTVFSVYMLIPQAILNWKRKSTYGWSVLNCILDVFAGLLSIVQVMIDYWGLDLPVAERTAKDLNIAKLSLGLNCVVFDILFIYQHFCLYRGNVPKSCIRTSASVENNNQEGLLSTVSFPLKLKFQ
jgi:cystinosin